MKEKKPRASYRRGRGVAMAPRGRRTVSPGTSRGSGILPAPRGVSLARQQQAQASRGRPKAPTPVVKQRPVPVPVTTPVSRGRPKAPTPVVKQRPLPVPTPVSNGRPKAPTVVRRGGRPQAPTLPVAQGGRTKVPTLVKRGGRPQAPTLPVARGGRRSGPMPTPMQGGQPPSGPPKNSPKAFLGESFKAPSATVMPRKPSGGGREMFSKGGKAGYGSVQEMEKACMTKSDHNPSMRQK